MLKITKVLSNIFYFCKNLENARKNAVLNPRTDRQAIKEYYFIKIDIDIFFIYLIFLFAHIYLFVWDRKA